MRTIKQGSIRLPPHPPSSTLDSVTSVVDPERRHLYRVGIVKTPLQHTAMAEMKNPPPSLLPPPLFPLRIKAHPPDIPPIAEVEVHSTYSIIISKTMVQRSHGRP
ncbi:hypothetical protein Y032_0053g2283 [Ancylostoma ceylanicum]|uniref:Uncharacterized protein n=1 Tax=Ancylostoma ceylanicum TaxID=53326 RepID=A0A016U7C8_9BILA|nr:hypothetical protein Y032_0053g2283 [Ancylostoma ceylanicum]